MTYLLYWVIKTIEAATRFESEMCFNQAYLGQSAPKSFGFETAQKEKVVRGTGLEICTDVEASRESSSLASNYTLVPSLSSTWVLSHSLSFSLSLSLLLTSISWPLVGRAQLIQIFCFSIFKTQNYCSNSAKLSLLVVRICWSSVKKIWAEFWRESFAQKLTNFKERVWRKFVEAPGPTGHVSFSRRRRCDSDCDSANSHHFQ